MELGKKLLQARLEAGLSQRQLCGDVITRNMLSQIEHGTARPSMATLQYLAARLGKSVSWFLEEGEEASPNQGLMAHARRAFDAGNWEEVRTILEGFRQPDPVFFREYCYFYGMTTLKAARVAMDKKKNGYAAALLQDLQEVTQELPGLERNRVLLLAELTDQGVARLCRQLPSLDEELYHRARGALEEAQWQRGLQLLDAMEVSQQPRCQLLRGRLCMGRQQWQEAARALEKAEDTFPGQTAPLLEQCYRELGDYKQAYFYACKQKK